jgi:dTDP-4-dehydrorhamnose 3,5-epimerase
MNFKRLEIPDLILCSPKILGDERGYFFESFNQKLFEEFVGQQIAFSQDNESSSTKGVLRGLHYQIPPFEQSKLVRVIKGSVLDVAVDLRQDSAFYGMHVAVELNEENKDQLFIPKGFAHGFLVLSDYAVFSYKVDNYYSKEHDRGLYFNDPTIGIKWPIAFENLVLSEKDKNQPLLLKKTFFH